MALDATGAGTPDNWKAFTDKVDQVAKLNVEAINKAADQFRGAATDAGDHSQALDNTTKALDSSVWSGQAADNFFDYVRSVRTAGAKVEAHLTDVANDLSTLAKNLGDIKSKVTNDKLKGAEDAVNKRNQQAQKDMDAATAAAKTAADQKKPAPSPSADQIKATAKQDINNLTTQYDGEVQALLTQANGMISQSQTLMKTQIEGGYDKVPLPGKGGTHPQSSGGIHTHGGGGGGGAGGGGGLGPSGGPPSSPPPGNVQQWIEEAIKILQANGVNVTDADIKNIWAIIQHESGGNPNAINNWDCVPLDTAILTKRGLLKHRDVEVGDETIGYNPQTGRSEWTRVTRVVHHENAPLVTLANSRWQATTTPNHRWLNFPRIPVAQGGPVTCPECGYEPRTTAAPANGVAVHRTKVHGVRAQAQQNTYATEATFMTSDEVGSRDRILLAAPADTESTLDVTVREAGILGWIAGDGHVEHRRHRPTVSIAQSEPAMVAKLRALLDGVPHAVYVDDRGGCGPRHQFRLGPDYAQDLLRRAGHPKSEAVHQVLAMSTEQREAWLEAVTDAEGTRHLRSGYTKPKVTIYQAPGEVLEAITLAVYLSGARPRVSVVDRTGEHESWRQEAAVRANNPVITGAFLHREHAGRGDVWCVTTELGTWTAREGDHVFLTGNSNAAAGHPSKGLMQCIDSTFQAHKLPGHDNIYNPVDNIIAGVRYSIDRYGSIGNVPGIQAMAHGGAYRGY